MKSIGRFLALLCIPATIILMLLVLIDVGSRIIIGKGITIAFSLELLMLVPIAFFCASASWKDGQFVELEFFKRRCNKRTKNIIDIISSILGLLCCSLIICLGIDSTFIAFREGTRPSMLQMPLWPWKLIIPIGALIFAYDIVIHIIQIIQELYGKNRLNNEHTNN